MHGGHVTAGVDLAEGLENWRKAVERIERPLPMLIENTAGGDGAMARSLDAIGKLWEAVTEAAGDGAENVGFCLDTCHANSAGIDLADAVDRIKAITGRIDLVHCNNSRDEFGSGRDRHANIASGTIDPALLLGVVRAAGRDRHLRDARGGRRPGRRRQLAEGAPARLAAASQPASCSRSRPEPVRGLVQDAPGRIIEAVGTHHVPFGQKNVPHHVGGEQAYGEEPGRSA